MTRHDRMDISEGRSEDSAGMAHGSNTRLQLQRATEARAAGYETDVRGSSVISLAIERRCPEIGDWGCWRKGGRYI